MQIQAAITLLLLMTLEALYNFGIIGLALFGLSVFYMLKNAVPKVIGFGNDRAIAVLASLFCICIFAGGVFTWQIGTTAFYTVVLVGLLHNNEFLNGGYYGVNI